jgi:hypothetical protein
MGSREFIEESRGQTVKGAFKFAVNYAADEHGYDGHTGSIAEKSTYVHMGTVDTLEEAYEKAQDYIDEDHPKISDKWGPAGYLQVKDTDIYVFFGYASC